MPNSYIFLIKPDDESVNDLESNIVKWDIPVSKKRLEIGDSLYIYFGAYDKKFSNSICYQNRIAYVGVVENVGQAKMIDKRKKVTIYMRTRELSFKSANRLSFDKSRLEKGKRKINRRLEKPEFHFVPPQGHIIDLQE